MLDLVWRPSLEAPGPTTPPAAPSQRHPQREGPGRRTRAYMPLIDYTRWGKRTYSRKDDYAYDAERDVYWCPAGDPAGTPGQEKAVTRFTSPPGFATPVAEEQAGAPRKSGSGSGPQA